MCNQIHFFTAYIKFNLEQAVRGIDLIHTLNRGFSLSDTFLLTPTFLPAKTQSASVSMAWLCLRPLSTSLASSIESSPGRPGSKAGEAIGDSSTLKRMDPSLGRSGKGGSRVAAMAVMTLVVPMVSMQLLSSRENCRHAKRL